MIMSMTGYGSASGTVDGLEITVEIRSVNNRFLDCSVRLPRVYTFAEDAIKAEVQKTVSRGKVDVFVSVDSSKAGGVGITVNEPLLEAYLQAFGAIQAKYGLQNDVSTVSISHFPDILQVEKKEADADQLTAAICGVLSSALLEYDKMRGREGLKLLEDIGGRLGEIERLLTLIEARSPKTVAEYRARLEARMSEILNGKGIEEARILTEAALFADKTAVDEETVRLRSHIDQLRGMLASKQPMGRKMDFLIQEFNREANTIGSKCNDAELSHIVVDMKAEIEKIREQAQNVE